MALVKFSKQQCLDLADKIQQAKDRLHEIRMGDHASEITTGIDKTRFNTVNEQSLMRHIQALEAEFARGSCAVILGQTNPARRPAKAIKPLL